jgi:hypothetical protein
MTPKICHLVDRQRPTRAQGQSCLLCGARLGPLDSYIIWVETVDLELQYYRMLDQFCVSPEDVCAFSVLSS